MDNNANNEKTLDELKAELEAARKAYASIQDSVNKREAEEKEKKRAQLALERDKRKKVIEEKEEELVNLIYDYIKDYGSYKTYKNASYDDIFSRLYSMFF